MGMDFALNILFSNEKILSPFAVFSHKIKWYHTKLLHFRYDIKWGESTPCLWMSGDMRDRRENNIV